LIFLSHDVLVPNKTVELGPFSSWRNPGRFCDSPKSTVRALQILELLVNSNGPLRAIDVVRALHLSPSSTSQLLKALMDWAYVIFDHSTKRYHPSPRLSRLGSRVSSFYFGHNALENLMIAVQRSSELTVTVSACQGSFMQIIEEVSTPGIQPNRNGVPGTTAVGLQVPLIGSCTGATWLSVQDGDTTQAALRLCRRELSWQAISERAILERLLQIRKQGYSYGGMTLDDGFRSLSIALPPTVNGLVLVLCMSGDKVSIEPRKDELAQVAKHLTKVHLG
jgi:DNA-binding IclR family transcriptional regulator